MRKSNKGKGKQIGTAFEYRVRDYINDKYSDFWTADRNRERDHFSKGDSGKYDVVITHKQMDVMHYIECKKTSGSTKFLLEYKWIRKIAHVDSFGPIAFGFFKGPMLCFVRSEIYKELWDVKKLPKSNATTKGSKYIHLTRSKIEPNLPYFLYSISSNQTYVITLFDDYMRKLTEIYEQ